MSLLKEIIEGATDDNIRLPTLLRRCLVLASKLENERLKAWSSSELNGYENADELPPYRLIEVQSKGFMLGPFQAQIDDQPLAAGVLKPEHRDFATKAFMMEPIASYETMTADQGANASLRAYWPGDLVAMYQSKFAQGWVLNRAWQEISLGTLVAIVDTVRTRLLQFALELQAEIGEDGENLSRADPKKVEHDVAVIIYGGHNVVAGSVAGDVSLQSQQMVVQGDFHSLASVLKEAGVPDAAIQELKAAEAGDRDGGTEDGFGNRVKAWLRKAGGYVGNKTGEITTETAKQAVTAAVMTYFGLAA